MCVIENFMLAVKNIKKYPIQAVTVKINIIPEIVTSFTCIRLKKGHIYFPRKKQISYVYLVYTDLT